MLVLWGISSPVPLLVLLPELTPCLMHVLFLCGPGNQLPAAAGCCGPAPPPPRRGAAEPGTRSKAKNRETDYLNDSVLV